MAPNTSPGGSAPLGGDLEAFAQCHRQYGLRASLNFLNRRTPHRYTAVFRFDGDMLRNVALVDKWDATVDHGADVPLEAAYCAHLHRTGEPLEVADGRIDPRVPWMRSDPVVSYCGAVIPDHSAAPWGALCHFDIAACDAKRSDMPLIVAAAKLIYGDALVAACD